MGIRYWMLHKRGWSFKKHCVVRRIAEARKAANGKDCRGAKPGRNW
jgi:hypothetical protein